MLNYMALGQDDSAHPLEATLYVTEQGALLRSRGIGFALRLAARHCSPPGSAGYAKWCA
jgi:hypothetical protein